MERDFSELVGGRPFKVRTIVQHCCSIAYHRVRAVHFGFYSVTKEYLLKRGLDSDFVHFISAFLAGKYLRAMITPLIFSCRSNGKICI